jgi:hypothetical protein
MKKQGNNKLNLVAGLFKYKLPFYYYINLAPFARGLHCIGNQIACSAALRSGLFATRLAL